MTRRRLLRAAAAVAALAVATLGVLYAGIRAGWFDSGDVIGTDEGFVATVAPPGPTASWPGYGYDPQRTRANPALRLAPPFRRAWRYRAGSLLEFPPVLDGERLVVGTNGGIAVGLDPRTGRRLWQRRLLGRVAASPALLPGDRVALPTTAGAVYMLRSSTGGVLWRADLGSAVESSPLALPGGDVVVGTLDGRVLRIGADGRTRWTARAAGDVKAGLARAGDLAVVGDYGGRVSAYRLSDGGIAWRATSPGRAFRGAGRFYGGAAVAHGRVYTANVNGRVLALDARGGAVRWVHVVPDLVYSSPAVAKRLVMVGGYDGRLRALDAVTGRERWAFDAGERISGSPSVVGDLVYFSTLARVPREGRTFALRVDTGRKVWEFPDGRYTPVAAVDGLLVVTGVNTLHGLVPR